MRQLINEMKDLAHDLEDSRLAGDDYDVWAVTNMIETRQEHLRDIMAGRC